MMDKAERIEVSRGEKTWSEENKHRKNAVAGCQSQIAIQRKTVA